MELDLFGVRWTQRSGDTVKANGLAPGIHQPDGASKPRDYQLTSDNTFSIEHSGSVAIANFAASFFFDTADTNAPGCCFFRLRFPAEQDATGVYRPANSVKVDLGDYHPQCWVVPAREPSPDSYGVVHLGGGLRAASKTTPASLKIEDNKLYFCAANNEKPPLPQGPYVPLRMSASDAAGCTFDLAKGTLCLQKGFLTVSTGYFAQSFVTQFRPDIPFAIEDSDEVEIAFKDLASTIPRRVTFSPRASKSPGPIPLHVGRLLPTSGGNLAMGMQAYGAGLAFTFRDGDAANPRIENISLLGRPGSAITLKAAAFRDLSNRPAPISVVGEIPLSVVPFPNAASKNEVACLVLDAADPKLGLSADTPAESVFGAAPGHNFRLGVRGKRRLELRVYPGARVPMPQDRSKAPYPQLREGSVPYVLAQADPTERVKVITSRPGTSWASVVGTARNQGSTARFEFEGTALGVPLVPEGLWGLKNPTPAKQLLDTYVKDLKTGEPEAWHESGMVQRNVAPTIVPERLFAPLTPGPASGSAQALPALVPKIRPVTFDLGPIAASGSAGGWTLGPRNSEYFVVADSSTLKAQQGLASLSLDREGKFLALNLDESDLLARLKGWPCSSGKSIRAILKFGRGVTLRDILDAEKVASDPASLSELRTAFPPITDDSKPPPDRSREEIFKDVLDPQILESPTWVGLVLFRPSLENKCDAFGSFLPTDRFVAAYVAIGPSTRDSSAASSKDSKPVVWTRLRYVEPPKGIPPDKATDLGEALHHVNYLDFAIASNEISNFLFKSTLQCTSFFGTKLNTKSMTIRGRLQRTNDGTDISFASDFTEPVPIFDGPIPGPLKQVYIQRIAIASAKSSVRILLDGRLDIADFDLGTLGTLNKALPSLDFRQLSIALPTLGKGLTLPRLTIDYPSIHLDVNVPILTLFKKLSVSLAGLAVDMPKVGLPALSWDVNLKAIKLPDVSKWFATDLQFAFADLPELADSSLSNLSFRFRLGFPFGGDWSDFKNNVRLSLSALSFEPLRLNLARVLAICADRCVAGASGFHLDNASITILGKPILGGLSASLTQQDNGDRTFLAAWLPTNKGCGAQVTGVPTSDEKCLACDSLVSGDLGFMRFDWFIAGQGLYLSDQLARQLVTIPDPTVDIQVGNEEIAKNIGSDPAGSNLTTPSGAGASQSWLFAAGFSVGTSGNGPLFSGRALFLDRRFYGLSLRGMIFEQIFDSPAAITGLYTRREPRSRDSFYISFTIPRMTFPAFQFTGGELSIEWFANGDFMFDGGFPHLLPAGGRDWRRSLGAIVTPFQGSGGIYIGMQHGVATKGDRVQFDYGFAVQAGLGAAFGAGVVTAWVTVGIYAILEGSLVVGKDFHLIGIDITGALGVLVRGGAQLNWWIISVRLEVVASAEIRGEVAWGENAEGKPLQKQCGGPKEVTMKVAFDLYCALSAEACIGSSPFRICKGITIGLHMPIEHCIVLGSM